MSSSLTSCDAVHTGLQLVNGFIWQKKRPDLFFCVRELSVFCNLSLVNTGSMIAVYDSLLPLCTGQPLASAFTIFGVFCFVCFVALVLCLCLDEDCNPGWGDCGRPLRLCSVSLPLMVKGHGFVQR